MKEEGGSMGACLFPKFFFFFPWLVTTPADTWPVLVESFKRWSLGGCKMLRRPRYLLCSESIIHWSFEALILDTPRGKIPEIMASQTGTMFDQFCWYLLQSHLCWEAPKHFPAPEVIHPRSWANMSWDSSMSEMGQQAALGMAKAHRMLWLTKCGSVQKWTVRHIPRHNRIIYKPQDCTRTREWLAMNFSEFDPLLDSSRG